MKKALRVALGVVALVLALFIGAVAYLYFVIFGNGDRTLARGIQVTNEWTEIRIDPPVKPRYNHQAIYVRPADYVMDRFEKGFDIRLPDGTVVKPEVEIYDEYGNAIAMSHIAFALGGDDYVDFSGPYKLPERLTYRAVRIRSDVPFICDRIKWIDYSPP